MGKRASFENLSNKELEIMNIFWDVGTPMTTNDIQERREKKSSNAYLFRLINSLLEKQFIKEVGGVVIITKKSRIFAPTVSRDEYYAYYFNTFCDSSMQTFLSGVTKISKQKKEILCDVKAWLKEQEEQEEEEE